MTLLQELANYPDSKFDWDDLVAKTSTGISNAREYQMLWRHLAYGHSFDENSDLDNQPLVCIHKTLFDRSHYYNVHIVLFVIFIFILDLEF